MIINELHKQFKELNDLRAREIRVDKQQRKVFCTLSFPNVSVLNTNLKNAVTNYVKRWFLAVIFVLSAMLTIVLTKFLFKNYYWNY